MDREMLMLHLRQAGRHIAQGERQLALQFGIIAELAAGGHARSGANALLNCLEEAQAMHIAHRDRLREELGLSTSRPA
jgi:hypothetical protein